MRLSLAGVTHRGLVRTRNEDTIALGGWLCSVEDGVPLEVSLDSADRVLLAVADGLGGHPAGDRASLLALRTLTARRDALAGPDALTAAIRRADAAIYEEMERTTSARFMGTTLAGFLLDGDAAFTFNVGDSRCYAASGGALAQVSTDDSPPSPDGRPTSVVEQTLGGSSAPDRELTPHIAPLTLRPGDRLLACTDGLSDVLGLDVLEAAVVGSATLAEAAAELVRRTLDAGAPDNVSLVLAEIPRG